MRTSCHMQPVAHVAIYRGSNAMACSGWRGYVLERPKRPVNRTPCPTWANISIGGDVLRCRCVGGAAP